MAHTDHERTQQGQGCSKVCSTDHVDIWETCFSKGYGKSVHCHTHQSVLQVATEHGSLFAKLLTSLEVFSMGLNMVFPMGGECLNGLDELEGFGHH